MTNQTTNWICDKCGKSWPCPGPHPDCDGEQIHMHQLPMNDQELELQVAARILAGLLSNPNVIAHNPNCGWSLVNCNDEQIASYAFKLALELTSAQKAFKNL